MSTEDYLFSQMKAAITLYGEWEAATGDSPHDERGCEAHEAIVRIYREIKP